MVNVKTHLRKNKITNDLIITQVYNYFRDNATVNQNDVYKFISRLNPMLSGERQAAIGNVVLTKLAEDGIDVV